MISPMPPNRGSLDSDEMLFALRHALTHKRVLIVDRHPPARDSLRLMLGVLGVTSVHGAGNAAEVVRQVKATRFDIILSDFVLDDGRDGQQLLEELRHARLIPLSTVYMIITSERAYNNVVSLAELAPDDYLIKPFTSDQLQARLIKAIYKKHILHRIYDQIERGALMEAIAACDRVIQQQPQYMYDGLRFKGELLHQLGRHQEAEAVFRRVLEARVVPWARMGLAMALRERGALDEAARLTEQVIGDAPEFLAAYDFLASVHEAQGRMAEAQLALQRAADVSPNNTLRQRLVGDLACANGDLLTAERAYGKVIERNRGSSLRSVDDFANLARVMADRGNVDGSRRIIADLKRERRSDREAELAAIVSESLCLHAEGDNQKASQCVEQALAIQQQLDSEKRQQGKQSSQRLAIDLAHACYATGNELDGARIMRQVAAENNDDTHLIGRITEIFARTGQAEAGKALLDQVSREIVELNNRGVMAARSGDLDGAVDMLMQAVNKVPSVQFLVNATKAICTLMDKRGWDADLATRAREYLLRAQTKDRNNPKVASARALYASIAKKYGINTDEPAWSASDSQLGIREDKSA